MSRSRRAALITGAVVAALAVASPAVGGAGTGAAAAKLRAVAPAVEQLVVFRDGSSMARRVMARQASVRVDGRRCAVGAATPLAALARSHVGVLRLHDYGSCSARPRDATGLFVRGIRGDRNRGEDGWVYKVGTRAGSAGAADPSGPFGAGRLRAGARVTWFYCRRAEEGCQRTLALRATPAPGGLMVRVRGHDDQGRGLAVAGATVRAGAATATTGEDGSALVAAASGPVSVYAEKAGMVRSFAERVRLP